MNIIKLVLIGLSMVDSDLIGFNRLGNNVNTHQRGRNRNKTKFGLILSKNSIPWDEIFEEPQLKRLLQSFQQNKN